MTNEQQRSPIFHLDKLKKHLYNTIWGIKQLLMVYWIPTFIFFRNSKFRNRNSDFSIFQQRNSKKIQPESSESKTESEFCFRWGSQKLEPKIGIPNLVLESYYFCDRLFQRAPPIFPPNHLGFSFVRPPAKKINILSILPPSVGLLRMKKSKEGGEEIN